MNLQKNGTIQLFDTAADATAGGTTGLMTLTSSGTGTHHVFKGAGDAGTAVGVAIAIDVAKTTNLATLGQSTINAQALTLSATTAARTISFDPTTAINGNTLALDTASLRDGDAVVYHHGAGGSDIAGLVEGQTYYVNLQADGSVKLYATQSQAIAGGSAGLVTLTGPGSGHAHSLVDLTAASAALALSGAGGGKTGVAGSLAINVALNDTEATAGTIDDQGVDHAATITLTGGDASLTASTATSAYVSALPTDGGAEGSKTGVGISVGFNYAQTTTVAAVNDGTSLTGAGKLSLAATSDQSLDTIAKSGAKGGTAVTPVIAISVAQDTTSATLGTGTGVTTTTGDISAVASLTDSATTEAQGDTQSGNTGVGISLGLAVVLDNAQASTQRSLTSGGAITLSSTALSGSQVVAKASVAGGTQDDGSGDGGKTSDQSVDKQATDNLSFADKTSKSADSKAKGTGGQKPPSASTSDGAVSVAGALAIDIELSGSQALIGDGLVITSKGALSVTSQAQVDGGANADGSAVLGQRDFNPQTTGAVDTTKNTIDIGDTGGLKTGDKVTYEHGADGSNIGGLLDGHDYYVNLQKNGTIQLFDTAADATAGGTTGLMTLTSSGTGTHHVFKGAGDAGTAVGVAIAIDVAKTTNLATLGQSTINAQALTLSATTAARTISFDPTTAINGNTLALDTASLRDGDAVVYHHGAGGSDIAGLVEGQTYYVNLQADGSVKLYATQSQAIAGGSAGLVTLTGPGSGHAHSLVDLTAASAALALSGAGGGKTGVAGSLAINVALNDTEATAGTIDDQGVDHAATITLTGGDASLTASTATSAYVSALPTDGGAEGSKTGVGISVGFNYAQTTTVAAVNDGTSLTGAGKLSLAATSDQSLDTIAKSGAKGGTAVTPVIAISVAQDTTSATLGTGTGVTTTTGDISAVASLTDSATTEAQGDTQSGNTGVGISLGLAVVLDNAQASTQRSLTSGGAITLSSTALSGSQVVAKASVAGGTQDDGSGDGGKTSDQSVDKQATDNLSFADKTSKSADSKAKGTGGQKPPSASTSDGAVSVAGALAIDIELSGSQALIGDGLVITSKGALSVTSQAQVDGGANADGSAVLGQRDFNPQTTGAVDTTKNTIDIGDTGGLKTGDKVTYEHGADGSNIGGLLDGHDYYVNLQKNGTIQLFDTAADATAGGTTGLMTLTSSGTGTHHVFKGAGDAGTAVGVAIAIDVAKTTNLATLGQSTINAQALTLSATTAARTISFDPTTAINGNTLALDTASLRDGDAVVYHHGAGGSDIAGLVEGQTYYVNLQADGSVKLYATQSQAIAGGSAGLVTLTGPGSGHAHSLVDLTAASAALALSGAGGGKTGVAGSLAINVALNDTEATAGTIDDQGVDHAATITLTGGDASLTASTATSAYVSALPTDGGAEGSKTGVGISVGFNYAQTTTVAAVNDGTSLTGAGKLSLAATSDQSLDTIAKSGAKGGTAVTPVIAISVAQDTTSATLGTGTGVTTTTGDISAVASLTDSATTEAQGDTQSGNTGVGISLGLAVVLDNAQASTQRSLTSGGAITLSSTALSGSQVVAKASVAGGTQDDGSGDGGKTSDQSVDKQATDNLSFADKTSKSADSKAKGTGGQKPPSASTSDGAVSVAGALAIDIELSGSQALIGDGLVITSKGALSVTSQAQVDGGANADGSAVLGQRDFNPQTTGAVDTTKNTIDIGDTGGLKTGDKVTYEHGADGSNIGGLLDGHDYYVNLQKNGTIQLFDTAADATAGGTTGLMTLTSSGTGTHHVFKGAGDAGTAVGVAIAIDVAKTTNLATLGQSTINAQALTLSATTAARTISFDPTTAINGNTLALDTASLRDGDAVVYHHGAGGSDIAGLVEGQTYYVNLQADGSVKLYATQSQAIAGGSAGLVTLTGPGSGHAHSLVDLTAASAALALSGAGGGKTGVAGSLAINVALNDTEATAGTIDDQGVDHAATITLTGGDASLTASTATSAYVSALPTDGGAEGSKTGVGISVGFNYAQTTTVAAVNDGTSLTGAGKLSLAATSDQSLDTIAKSGAKGGTAVTPVIAISVAQDTTSATLGTGTGVTTTTGDISAVASLTDSATTEAQGDTQSGNTGVGISLGLAVVLDNAQASTQRSLTSGGAITLSSTALSGSQVVAKASVAGGTQDDGSGDGGKTSDQSVDKQATDNLSFADKTSKSADSKAKGTGGQKPPSASTSDGAVSVAGALAIDIELSGSQALIGDGLVITSKGALSVTSQAQVDGGANADGSAVLGQRDFNPQTTGAVDTTKNTIDIGDTGGLKTGDKVTYEHGADGSNIGGLLDGHDYYVNLQKNGTIQLFDTAADATAGGTTGLMTLTSSGTGTHHVFKGAGDAGTAVGVAIAIDVAKTTNLATLGQSTINAQALTLSATTAARTISFDPTTAINGNTLALDTASLRDGDAVVYHHGAGGSDIAGLVEGQTYYVNLQADGSVKLYATQSQAIAGGSAGLVTLTGPGSGHAHSLVDLTAASAALALSGAGGGKTGVAGSLAINVALNDTEATAGTIDDQGVDHAATITLTGGDASLTASTATSAYVSALPTDGGAEGSKTGVGISVGFNYAQTTTVAAVNDGTSLTGAGKLSLAATSDQSLDTIAKSGAKGGTAVTPVIAISVAQDTTSATLGTGTGVTTTTGDISAVASLTDSATTEAQGDTQSGNTGVGISLGLAVVLDNAQASTQRSLTSGGAITLSSTALSGSQVVAKASVAGGTQDDGSGDGGKTSDQSVDKQATDNLSFADKTSKSADSKAKGTGGQKPPSASTSDGAVSVAGALAIDIELSGSQSADRRRSGDHVQGRAVGDLAGAGRRRRQCRRLGGAGPARLQPADHGCRRHHEEHDRHRRHWRSEDR